jgi:protein-disulfide isomerase
MRPILIAAFAAFAVCAAAAAPAAAADALTPEQQRAVDERVRAYLLANPELIVEALDELERRRQSAQADADADIVAANAAALTADGFSPVFGNPDGDVTIVKFSDYRCGYCKAAHPVLTGLLAEDPGLRLVVKEFPILGPDSTLAARAAMAAEALDPGRFPAFHDAMLGWQGALDEAAVFRLAAEAGYDEATLRLEMEEPAIADNLRATFDLARSLGLEGTPSFVIGSRVLRGFAPAEQMRALIDEARRDDG